MWKTTLIILSIAVAAAVPAGAEDQPIRSAEIRDGQLSIPIPASWIEIDPTHLEELTMWTADTTHGRMVEVYQHGFRPPEVEDSPLLPSILVQVRESGRLPYGRFVHLQPIDDLKRDTKMTYPNGLPPLIVGVAIDNAEFDQSLYCLRLEHSLDLSFKGRVTILTAAFLTEKGFVTLRFADRERRIDQGRKLFDRIVAGVRISPEIAYRPKLSDRWPGLPFFLTAAVVAAALAVYLLRRRLPLT